MKVRYNLVISRWTGHAHSDQLWTGHAYGNILCGLSMLILISSLQTFYARAQKMFVLGTCCYEHNSLFTHSGLRFRDKVKN